jgi:uncharacterized protein
LINPRASSVDRPPLIRGGRAARLIALIVGLFVFAAGIVALLQAGLGLSPWDVLHQGLANRTPLSLGTTIVAASVVVVGVAWRLGGPLGIGTVLNAALVGVFVDLLLALEPISALAGAPPVGSIVLLATGIAMMSFGTALYIGAGLGAGPRDALMVAGAARLPLRIGAVRATIEAAVLGGGLLLGGTAGVGTLVFVVAIGPALELAFRGLARSPLTADPAVGHGVRAPRDRGAGAYIRVLMGAAEDGFRPGVPPVGGGGGPLRSGRRWSASDHVALEVTGLEAALRL